MGVRDGGVFPRDLQRADQGLASRGGRKQGGRERVEVLFLVLSFVFVFVPFHFHGCFFVWSDLLREGDGK